MNYDNYDCRIRVTPAKAGKLTRRKTSSKGQRSSRGLGRVFAALRAVTTVGAAMFALATSAQAQITVQPVTEALSKDTKIYNHVPTINFSSNLFLTSGSADPDDAHFLALVQFDLGSVWYPSADITSASITLYSPGLGLSGSDPILGGTVTISPILDGWKETMAEPGAAPLATYNAFFGASPTIDVGASVASQEVNGAGFYTWDITDLLKQWKDGSLENNGVLIRVTTPGADLGIASATSHGNVMNGSGDMVSSAPSLTVVPEPGSAALAFLGASVFFARRRRASAQ